MRTEARRSLWSPLAAAVRPLLAWAALSALCAGAAPESGAPIRFLWAVLCRDEGGTTRALDCAGGAVDLESGDRFRILLEPASRVFVYLYLYDAEHRLFLLHPQDASGGGGDLEAGLPRCFPSSDSWYRLDDEHGTETFYLIVSGGRLPGLEAATRRYLEPRRVGAGSPDAVRRVLEEIRRLSLDGSPLSGRPERPVSIAGSVRGVEEETDVGGTAVTADGVYVKTIRLRH